MPYGKNVMKSLHQGQGGKFGRLVCMASISANRNFLPYEEQYQDALDSLSDYDRPRAIFASAKYAWYYNTRNNINLTNKS
jgi:hypothetical protein